MRTMQKNLTELQAGDVIVDFQGVKYTVISPAEPDIAEIWDGEDFVPTTHAWRFTTEYDRTQFNCGLTGMAQRVETVAPTGGPETIIYRVVVATGL